MGVLEDSVFIMTTIFGGSVMLLCGLFLISQLLTIPQLNTSSAQIIQTNFNYLDGAMVIAVIGFSAASVALAYFIPSHPVFFFSYFIVALIVFIIGPVYANAYAALATNPTLAATAQLLPYTALIIGNIPLISFIVSGLIAVVSFAKKTDNIQALG